MKKAITKQAKPDYIDIDGDGNKKESMKEAANSIAKQTNSWEEEDKKRGRKFAAEGKMGHADALFDDAHDSYNWKGGNDGSESMSTQKKSFAMQFSDKSPVARFQTYDQMDSKIAMDTAAMQYKDSMAMKKGCQISKHSSSNFKK